MTVLLVTPPLTQLNTPYPATAFLARGLGERGIPTTQRDLGIELVLRLLSPQGLEEVFDEVARVAEDGGELPEPAWRALALRDAYVRAVGPVVRFLQGRDRTLAARILGTSLLPAGPRVEAVSTEDFGPHGVDDAARHLATLWIEDVVDLVTACVDPGFALARYQHHLAAGPVAFDSLSGRLGECNLVDRWLDALADTLPEAAVAGITAPFPGTLYGALRVGRRLRERGTTVVLGGGFVNTELRGATDPRLWQYVDALVFDEGSEPLAAIVTHREGGADGRHRTRTAAGDHDPGRASTAFVSAAAYGDLPLDHYLQVLDPTNPAHRLWSDGRWNKVVAAHGCYWRRCAFCDVNLDYVARFQPARAVELAQRMEELATETGCSGFHLVDEAAPPRVLRELALELLRRGLVFTWWGNIRFETAFTPDLCRLLSAAGLVAVTGGLEVASDRLLALMDKGVTVDQAARTCRAFREAGVLVHAYLMYGFPTQTEQETVDAMEVVRQLFAAGLLDSAFWHRFVLTRHAPMFAAPERFGIEIDQRWRSPGAAVFAANDVPHRDPSGGNHDRFDDPLVASLDAWKRGQELDRPVDTWLPWRAPHTAEPADRITRAVAALPAEPAPQQRLVWLGGDVLAGEGVLVLHHGEGEERIEGSEEELAWLEEVLDGALPTAPEPLRVGEAMDAFPGQWRRFRRRWSRVRRAGLVAV